jgi:hypothetical protein
MRRLVWIALAVTLLASRPLSSAQSPVPTVQSPASQTPAATGAISGVVTDAATGRPIAGASVSVFVNVPAARRPPAPPSVLTDVRGRFVLVDLAGGQMYEVGASRSGYAPAGPRTTVALADGEWRRDVNLRLSRAGSIAGRVIDERGEPMVGTPVQLFFRRMLAGRERLVESAVVTTDDRGVYRFALVRPGAHYLGVLSVQATVPVSLADGPRRGPLGGLLPEGRASPGAQQAEAQGASIDVDGRHRLVLTSFATPPPPGSDRSRAYAPVFYPNARSLADARPIELGVGESRTNVDFQLTPVPAARLSGRVSGSVQNAANMLLRLMPHGAEHLGFGMEAATTIVEADGSFTFLNVPAGSYTLVASPSIPEIGSSAGGGISEGRLPTRAPGLGRVLGLSVAYPPALEYSATWWRASAGEGVWGRMPVTVGETDLSGIELRLQPAASVRGRVVFDDPSQLDPSQRFTVSLEPANGDSSLGVPFALTAAGDTSYTFSIPGLEGGRYLFRFQAFGGWRVASIMSNGADVTETGFDGSSGQDYSGVVVTVTKTGAALSGRIADRNGRPASGGVMLFPVDPASWVDYGLTPQRLRSTSAGDGTFTLTAIPDGDYYVIAVPATQTSAWTDPRFLRAAVGQATRVSLTTGAPRTVALVISEVVVR